MKAQTAPTESPAPMQALTQDVGRQLASPNRELASPSPAPTSRSVLADADLTTGQALRREESGATMGEERPVTPSPPPTSLGDRIAERAYYLYLARHGEEGDALSDWLEAERQVCQEESIHG